MPNHRRLRVPCFADREGARAIHSRGRRKASGRERSHQKVRLLNLASILLLYGATARGADTWGSESLSKVSAIGKTAVSMAYCATFNFAFTFAKPGEQVDLKADIEERLRLGRVPLTDKALDPFLMLVVDCARIETNRELGFAVGIRLTLFEDVLVHATKEPKLAATWETNDLFTCQRSECAVEIRRATKDAVDALLSDMLKSQKSAAPK
jgi:hypothetical protein